MDKFVKIVYFDESYATDYCQLAVGGILTERRENTTETEKQAHGNAEGELSINSEKGGLATLIKLVSGLTANMKASGETEASAKTDKIAKKIIENTVLSYVEPYASSACEMVAEILQYYSDDLRIKATDAEALYSGIVVDTNNFLNKTGVRTFEAAAFLRRSGADVTRVRKLFRDDMDDYKAKAEIVRGMEVYLGCYAISVCPASMTHSPTVIAAQAANELLGIRDVKASFVLTDYDRQIYISARSIDELNVQVIMEKLGGGGHLSVAGAQLKDTTIEQAKELLKEVLRQQSADEKH